MTRCILLAFFRAASVLELRALSPELGRAYTPRMKNNLWLGLVAALAIGSGFGCDGDDNSSAGASGAKGGATSGGGAPGSGATSGGGAPGSGATSGGGGTSGGGTSGGGGVAGGPAAGGTAGSGGSGGTG